MKLNDWMKTTEPVTKPIDLARALKVNCSTVCRYLENERTPCPEMARRIVKLTGGEVSFNDIYAPSRRRPKTGRGRDRMPKVA